MRNMLFMAVSRGRSRGAPGLALLALCAPLLIAATPLLIAATPLELPASQVGEAPVVVAADPGIATALPNDDRREIACWLALCIGAGGIVAVSRRRRRVTTA